jgi:hypothetical protein
MFNKKDIIDKIRIFLDNAESWSIELLEGILKATLASSVAD